METAKQVMNVSNREQFSQSTSMLDARVKGKFSLHQIHSRAILSYPGMGLNYSKTHQFVNTYLYIWK